MTNTNRPDTATMTAAERRAFFMQATATITMPDRPADRSRNGTRIPRSVSHRAIR